jgi:hypothetical protein
VLPAVLMPSAVNPDLSLGIWKVGSRFQDPKLNLKSLADLQVSSGAITTPCLVTHIFPLSESGKLIPHIHGVDSLALPSALVLPSTPVL